MRNSATEQPSLIDRALKALIRRAAPAFFRLAHVEVDPRTVRSEDVTINLPEHRADQVFVIGTDDDPDRWAMHLEYQLEPDARRLKGWFLKNAALTAQLECEVILTVVYLTRGRYATFPDAYAAQRGALKNRFEFHVIHLWEHAERIRSGELPELAPLLVLCENRPTERTLQRERELILGLAAPPEVRAEMLGLAAMVATRHFSRELIQTVFREEMHMLKEASFVQDWLDEALAEGRAQGVALGETSEAREFLLLLLRGKFGELPAPVVQRVGESETTWCKEMGVRLLRAESLQELFPE